MLFYVSSFLIRSAKLTPLTRLREHHLVNINNSWMISVVIGFLFLFSLIGLFSFHFLFLDSQLSYGIFIYIPYLPPAGAIALVLVLAPVSTETFTNNQFWNSDDKWRTECVNTRIAPPTLPREKHVKLPWACPDIFPGAACLILALNKFVRTEVIFYFSE